MLLHTECFNPYHTNCYLESESVLQRVMLLHTECFNPYHTNCYFTALQPVACFPAIPCSGVASDVQTFPEATAGY